jgi:hypothetical protein
MAIEIKSYLSSVGTTESVVGAIVLAALAYLLQSILFRRHDLSHIPLAGEELGSRGRLKEMSYNSKVMFRKAYLEVSE